MKIAVETLVHAPAVTVWTAYTKPEDIKAWNTASADWHTTGATVDLRESGKFSFRMEAKDGRAGFDFAGTYMKGTFIGILRLGRTLLMAAFDSRRLSHA